MDFNRYRRQLNDEHARLLAAQTVLTDQQGTTIGNRRVVDVDDAAPQDPAEVSEQLADRGVVLDELAVLDAELTEVTAALVRLDEGVYGRCDDCGEQIAEERLSALPTARRCANDQRRYEDGQTGLIVR